MALQVSTKVNAGTITLMTRNQLEDFIGTMVLRQFARRFEPESSLSFQRIALFAVVNRLGHSVEVRISAKERAPEKSQTRVLIG